MSIEKEINKFAQSWVRKMAKDAPVGKRPRSKSAKSLYPEPLNKSITVLDGPEPLISMNLYGVFVDEGTRYMSAQPFITKAFDQAAKAAGDDISDAAFEEIGKLFDKTFK
tara:strand:+ start:282 stop:611 length:330 start_codon:yes stop_codon:yes gene_type:complete